MRSVCCQTEYCYAFPGFVLVSLLCKNFKRNSFCVWLIRSSVLLWLRSFPVALLCKTSHLRDALSCAEMSTGHTFPFGTTQGAHSFHLPLGFDCFSANGLHFIDGESPHASRASARSMAPAPTTLKTPHSSVFLTLRVPSILLSQISLSFLCSAKCLNLNSFYASHSWPSVLLSLRSFSVALLCKTSHLRGALSCAEMSTGHTFPFGATQGAHSFRLPLGFDCFSANGLHFIDGESPHASRASA